jgi:hypothetical protein
VAKQAKLKKQWMSCEGKIQIVGFGTFEVRDLSSLSL